MLSYCRARRNELNDSRAATPTAKMTPWAIAGSATPWVPATTASKSQFDVADYSFFDTRDPTSADFGEALRQVYTHLTHRSKTLEVKAAVRLSKLPR